MAERKEEFAIMMKQIQELQAALAHPEVQQVLKTLETGKARVGDAVPIVTLPVSQAVKKLQRDVGVGTSTVHEARAHDEDSIPSPTYSPNYSFMNNLEDLGPDLQVIVVTCRELGIGIVVYSPLGRGFFSGKAITEELSAADGRQTRHPRFQKENLEKNKVLYDRVSKLAEKHGCTPGQLALAWVLHQGNDVVPIPGTSKIKNLEENLGALNVKLSQEDLKEIAAAVPVEEVAGMRYPENHYKHTYKFANTPPWQA
ncbi:hypothetical protein L7F22_003676 [Adiantum nelumboides]|nr:hypothetical protein [Adiantum nelumboides]